MQEKNEPGELSEKGLGLLFRKRLSAEPRPLAYSVALELGFSHGRAGSVYTFLNRAVENKWAVRFPIDNGDTYEITREGCFEFWDCLVRSKRTQQLDSLRKTSRDNYPRKEAEKLFAAWYKEWMETRASTMKSIAAEATNRIVGSSA